MRRSVRGSFGAAVVGFAAACTLITSVAVADVAWWGRPAPAESSPTVRPVAGAPVARI